MSLRMEFGKSHLRVRNPINSKSEVETVRDHLARRNIFIKGQWSLLIDDSEWSVSVGDQECNCHHDHSKIDPVLSLLDDQKVTSVEMQSYPSTLVLNFDLGGILKMGQLIAGLSGDLWTFSNFDLGIVVAGTADGRLVTEKIEPRQAGTISIK